MELFYNDYLTENPQNQLSVIQITIIRIINDEMWQNLADLVFQLHTDTKTGLRPKAY